MSLLPTVSALLGCCLPGASKLETVVPRGGQRGTEIVVNVTAADVGDEAKLVFSAPGVRSEKAGKNAFKVWIAEDARLGDCDVRVVDGQGMSNPRIFTITDVPVILEHEPNDNPNAAQSLPIPCVVEAAFQKGADVDFFAIGDRGGQVEIELESTRLDSLAKAVKTAYGTQVSGRHVVRVVESAHAGGGDRWYRFSVLDGPQVRAFFPPVVPVGSADVTLQLLEETPGDVGRTTKDQAQRRTVREVQLDATHAERLPGLQPFGFAVRYRPPQSRRDLHVRVTDLPIVIEQEESNDQPSDAQTLTWPCEIVGRFELRADRDWYRFNASKGDRIFLEAQSPIQAMDLEIAVHDAKGKRLATLDDAETPKTFPAEYALRSKAPIGVWSAPADGEYQMVVRDLQGGIAYGLDHIYWVTMERAGDSVQAFALEPDDASGWMVPRGGSTVIQVASPRWRGFAGPLEVRAKSVPAGLVVTPAWIPKGADVGYLVVAAAGDAEATVYDLDLEVAADGETKSFPVPSLTRLGKNNLARVRQAEGTLVTVGDEQPAQLRVELAGSQLPLGGKLVGQVQATAGLLDGSLQCEWVGLPKELTGKPFPLSPDKLQTPVELAASAKAAPGRYTAVLKASYQPKKKAGEKNAPPAVTIWSNGVIVEVVAKQR